MLKVLRQRGVQHKIFIGLAIAVISSFVLSGILLNNEDSASMGALGKIGKHSISAKDYLDSYRAVTHQLQFMFGERWSEMRRFVNLKGEAWDRILLQKEALRRGFRASDKEVVEWIASQVSFQRQGKYYPELYRMAVREGLRMEPRDFEEEMRNTLSIQKLTQNILSDTKVDDKELREMFNSEKAVRDIEYILLQANTDPSIQVEDKEIASLYELVKSNLTDPARVKISFVSVPKSELEPKKDILEDKTSKLDALAVKLGTSVKSTGFFSKNEAVPEIGLSR